jgi:putative endonuclease
MYYLYILHSSKAMKYYVGYSLDPWRRVIEHNTSPHITFTSKHRPWKLIAVFKVSSLEADAMRAERFIKKQKSQALIRKLIDPTVLPTGLLAKLVRVPHMRD